MGNAKHWLVGAAAAKGGLELYRQVVRPRMYTWGAQPGELCAVLPGDELVSLAVPRTTRGVTVDAPVEVVWPWLAHMGEDRGGFYYYDWLQRSANPDSTIIDPEWQELQAGDTLWLAHRYGQMGKQVVAAVLPKSHLVLMSELDYDRVLRNEKAQGSWSFCLIPHGRRTRVLARSSGGAVGAGAFDIAHFVMEQRMLRGIRRHAESGN
jgi:hypothetical protein